MSERIAMNDVCCLIIPSNHVAGVTETLLGLYGAHAEALGATALAFLDGSEELADLERARGELRALENALADVGWPRAPQGGAVELVGPAPMLREVVRAALLDAADGVVEMVGRYEAGREELPAVRLAVEAVPALFEVFAGCEGDRNAPSALGG
jgi:hypothetical protein